MINYIKKIFKKEKQQIDHRKQFQKLKAKLESPDCVFAIYAYDGMFDTNPASFNLIDKYHAGELKNAILSYDWENKLKSLGEN